MYEAFFGLKSRPFSAGPRAERYFPGAAIEAARQVLGRCVERAEGAGLVIGPAGTGKTLLLQVLAKQFRETLQVACLASGRLTSRKEMLQAILFELGLPYRGLDEGESRLSLIDHLSQSATGFQGLLLLVDEAHTLPLKLLEELRLITNLVRQGQPRVRLVLAGGPVLEERFASPRLEAFNQRLAARCYLEGFERSETSEYIRGQLRMAGGAADQLITGEALDAAFRATDGIPRLINQVCDHALILAFAAGSRQLTKPLIEEAWADLQQLPLPWNSTSNAAADSNPQASIIEFGSLEEEPDDSPAAVPFRTTASPNLALSNVDRTREEPIDLADEDLEELPMEASEFSATESSDEEAAEEEYDRARFAAEEFTVAPPPRPSRPAEYAGSESLRAEADSSIEPRLRRSGSTPVSLPPVQQLSQIVEQLASLDFEEPLIAQGESPLEALSTVDVVYPPAEHPFQDQFEEEEVVVDRYAALTAGTFHDRPQVSSREGQELSRLLTSYEIRPASAPLSLAAETAPAIRSTTGSHTPSAPLKCAAAYSGVSQIAASLLPVLQTELAHEDRERDQARSSSPSQPAADRHAEAAVRPVALEMPSEATVLVDEDADLIVIEDAPPEALIAAPVSPQPVRRQEYRQLFAKLRRG
ncbi:MAG TPA: AAA family ATPase [Pirellulales bacterium]|nr:AAA family ATPase [Pirellulales bacterium]